MEEDYLRGWMSPSAAEITSTSAYPSLPTSPEGLSWASSLISEASKSPGKASSEAPELMGALCEPLLACIESLLDAIHS